MNNFKFVLIGYYHSLDYGKSEFYHPYNNFNFDAYHPKEIKYKLDNIINLDWALIVISSVNEIVFNIFGHYVAEKKLNKEDIRIIIFDEYHNKIECGYDDDGFLANGYPFGFFEYL